MTSVRYALIQNVFQPNSEKLLSVCHVGKYLKKKKASYLCIASTGSSGHVNIVQVKQTDKTYKRKCSWSLSDLKAVDGKSEDSGTLEFDLQLDKIYRWVASNVQERHLFIVTLWRQCCKLFPKEKPIFKNIAKAWIPEDVTTPTESTYDSEPIAGFDNDLSEEIQPITEKEQEDLNKLMSDCQFAISNAEAFMEVLARDLSLLDGENVQSVLASDVDVLMEQLEIAINEADKIEKRLDSYDEKLSHIRDTMEAMGKKTTTISIVNKNNLLLYKELEKIVTQLDIDGKHQLTLENPDFTSTEHIQEAIEAGIALRTAMNSNIDPPLLRLAAVQEQNKLFKRYKEKFSYSLTRQFNNLFIHYGNHKGEILKNSDGLALPQHNAVHKDLHAYIELMHWMKVMDKKVYEHLKNLYTESLGKLYDRDMKRLFEIAKDRIGVSGSVSSPTRNVALLGLDRDQWTLETSTVEKNTYESILDQLLTQLEPVCLQEQQFCVTFFQLDVLSPSTKNTQTTLDGIEDENVLPEKKPEKKINEDVRNVMSSLFSCLEEELLNFIALIEKHDTFYSMYVLVCLNQHVMSAKSTFLSNTFASILIYVKRSLDRFMQTQIDSIVDCRISRRSKSGILPYVFNLEEFSRYADVLLKSERRADLEKWYTRLIDTIIEYIAVHSNEHAKTPSQVVKMENYHHLHSILSQMKISVLDAQKKEAKQRYNDALTAYVTLYFGRPLEKLNMFFDGVQAKVSSGVKASEVSYQLAFSKQELRKVINQYPGSTVKRGLEALYKKVDKHLSEEGNLLQVVWRAMQEEFIQQHKTLEDLIQQCYPGSMITLEFTINDILNFFSDIARSH